MQTCTLNELTGFKFGHAQDQEAATGVTVVIAEEGMTAGVDVRGSAPGTRETDLLDPTNMVDKVHAIFLAGGSAFGLDASSGIMKYLDEAGIGFPTGYATVPIVTGAILFDLNIGNPKVRPGQEMGYQAAKEAKLSAPPEGNFGCGTGATVGKFLGEQYAMKGGLGVSAFKSGDLIVGSLVGINCFGEVVNPETGKIVAGAYDRETDKFIEARPALANAHQDSFLQNTTIGIVVTNAELTKAGATKVSEMAQSGISRTTRPAHTMLDGDALFTMASGKVKAELSLVGDMAALAVEQAILRGITKATSLHNYPAYQDIST